MPFQTYMTEYLSVEHKRRYLKKKCLSVSLVTKTEWLPTSVNDDIIFILEWIYWSVWSRLYIAYMMSNKNPVEMLLFNSEIPRWNDNKIRKPEA